MTLQIPTSSSFAWHTSCPFGIEESKVERSLRTDQEEFYQLLTYTDDVDLPEGDRTAKIHRNPETLMKTTVPSRQLQRFVRFCYYVSKLSLFFLGGFLLQNT